AQSVTPVTVGVNRAEVRRGTCSIRSSAGVVSSCETCKIGSANRVSPGVRVAERHICTGVKEIDGIGGCCQLVRRWQSPSELTLIAEIKSGVRGWKRINPCPIQAAKANVSVARKRSFYEGCFGLDGKHRNCSDNDQSKTFRFHDC